MKPTIMHSIDSAGYMEKKILVVDDDEGILESLEVALTMEEYTVETTAHGSEVSEKITSFSPQLIILDVLLSGKDGRDIAKKLKRQKLTKHIPIIMISAHPNVKSSTLKAGANSFLSKPFDMDELFSVVKRLLH